MEQLVKNNIHKDELSPIQLEGMKSNTVTDFDLYIEVAGNLVLYAPGPYRWSQSELQRLQSDGYDQLLYEKSNHNKVEAYRKVGTLQEIREYLPPEDRIIDITDVAAEFSKVLFEHPLGDSTLHEGEKIAKSLVNCLQEDMTAIRALGKLAEHDQYTYYHGGRVGAYVLAIAMKMSMSSKEDLEQLAIGCLLHDVGKCKVDRDIIHKRGPLNEREWDLVRQHPEFGLQQIAGSDLGVVPLEIVLHHHERPDGKGYPHGLKSNEIMEEVSIAAFADVFDALTSTRSYQKARTRYQALDFIRFNLLEHLNKDAFRVMVEIFGKEE
jgi:HD-GYP domain-containing protein (c-di-GMP phosphodiesterase class II)